MSDLVRRRGPRFAWQPADGQRHCYSDDHLLAWGGHVMSLCGKGLAARRVPREDWLWPTCPDCAEEARRIQAGV